MSDDHLTDLEHHLDLLASIYRRKVGGIGLAEALFAAANGLLALEGILPRYMPDDKVLILPFADTETLESTLDDFLTHRALCVPVNGVPLMEEITVKVVAGKKFVDLEARSVQQTVAGVVLQILTEDVETQRELIALPGALRVNPRKAEVSRDLVRVPELVSEQSAENAFQKKFQPVDLRSPAEDSFAELAADSRATETSERTRSRTGAFQRSKESPPADNPRVTQRFDASSTAGSTSPRSTQQFDHTATRRETAARTGLRKSTIDAAEVRLRSDNLFEVLGIHFSANEEDVEEARDELLEMLEPQEQDDEELKKRIERIREEIRKASDILMNETTRRRHRRKVSDAFQLASAVEMFFRRAETAKMRKDAGAAVKAYERVLELAPDDDYARRELGKMKRGEFD